VAICTSCVSVSYVAERNYEPTEPSIIDVSERVKYAYAASRLDGDDIAVTIDVADKCYKKKTTSGVYHTRHFAKTDGWLGAVSSFLATGVLAAGLFVLAPTVSGKDGRDSNGKETMSPRDVAWTFGALSAAASATIASVSIYNIASANKPKDFDERVDNTELSFGEPCSKRSADNALVKLIYPSNDVTNAVVKIDRAGADGVFRINAKEVATRWAKVGSNDIAIFVSATDGEARCSVALPDGLSKKFGYMVLDNVSSTLGNVVDIANSGDVAGAQASITSAEAMLGNLDIEDLAQEHKRDVLEIENRIRMLRDRVERIGKRIDVENEKQAEFDAIVETIVEDVSSADAETVEYIGTTIFMMRDECVRKMAKYLLNRRGREGDRRRICRAWAEALSGRPSGVRVATIERYCESKFPVRLYNIPCRVEHFEVNYDDCVSVLSKMCN